MYKCNPDCYGAMFAIPASVADTYLAEAPGDSVKALLLIFRNPSGAVCVSAISEKLGLTADEVLHALDYWVQKGILLFTDEVGNVKYVPKAERKLPEAAKTLTTATPTAPAEKSTPLPAATAEFPKPTMEQITARIREDNTVRSLFSEAQSILGRTIGLDMQTTLLTLFDTYGLKKEVILTLVQYLSEHGRGATANILRTGKIWAEREINTLDEANEYIQNDTQVQHLFAQFRTATGISTPRPTQKQSDFLLSWTKMGLSMELILKAYEETAERTGKLSFAYMDKILKNWHEAGLNSAHAVDTQQAKTRAEKSGSKQEKRSYDLDDAVQRILKESETQA
ncbi:MAG: DnaD domain protein [Candidatus Fimenecus sp.]